MDPKSSFADSFNQTISCKTLNLALLYSELELNDQDKGLYQEMITSRPHLFSSTMVFISENDKNKMKDLIQSLEKVISSRPFKDRVLKDAPEFAWAEKGPRGVFMGYDFHLASDGPKLIEINTNAGGGLLNVELAHAQTDCCVEHAFNKQEVESKYLSMFRQEWKLQHPGVPLKSIAIVDENPESQFLYPEFKLFKRLFERNGIQCVITDPTELTLDSGKLYHGGHPIDLVYNRTTDFYLKKPQLKVIREAYDNGLSVITPGPYHHALYANKLNLKLMGDLELLKLCGLSQAEIDLVISGVPKTVQVNPSGSEELWNQRKNFFFKPIHGYGSKASYRGDKITKKVWEEILTNPYVAQIMVPPGYRLVEVEGEKVKLKVDIRAYVYQGEIQLLAARLYSGQTTNFRTTGGGFAPVFITN
jgi:hypothetical protein